MNKQIKVKHLTRNSSVLVSGRNAVVIYPSLNKVRVRLEDGSEKMVSYQQIKQK